MRIWRLVKKRFAATAFDGEGARLYGGRWNSVGTRVAYASDSAALAVLEVLVHLDDAAALPDYALVTASLPDEVVHDLDPARLPEGWDRFPPPAAAQHLGDAWVRNGSTLALRLPSAVVPDGSNLLINPQHRDIHLLKVESVAAYAMDPRLGR